MSETEHNAEHLDSTDAEDAEILLADPDDYHKTQRLKEIHDARQKVAEQVRDLDIPEREPGVVTGYSIATLSHTIALYADEILPLVKQADAGPIELPDACHHDTVSEFAKYMGMKTEGQGEEIILPPNHSMVVYRACNDFLADVKPLIEDSTDEWEI